MTKQPWSRVKKVGQFKRGYKIKYAHTVANDVATETTSGVLVEPFSKEMVSVTVQYGTKIAGITFDSYSWYQKPPKLMQQPEKLHSMVEVADRQFILCDTQALPDHAAWREITDYNFGSSGIGWRSWAEIVKLGTPVPYKPEEEQ